MRSLPLGALLLTLSVVPQADAAPAPAETVIRLTVQPMSAPKPALKYQLLPELGELNPGNPIPGYMKCFMEQNHFFFNKQSEEDREKWQTMPLKKLPLGELRNYGGWALRQADWAARLDTLDWQILLRLKSDGISLLIPEVQQMRRLASALKVRFRVEIADRRFDDAVVTAKTMLAMARHLGEHPTLIGDLVGIAIGFVTIGPLEEMIEQPGGPNLFWALTDLPHPFIDLHRGLQGERVWLLKEFVLLKEDAVMSDAQLQQVADHFGRLMILAEGPGTPKADVRKWLDVRVKSEAHVRAARRRLTEVGLAADKIAAFPALQVVLLDDKLAFEVERDDLTKALALPYWQAEVVIAAHPKAAALGGHLYSGLLASYGKVKMAQDRLEQRLALLRCVEALRLHAAEHGGQLPAQLDDIKLPLPIDPMTGKAFPYQLNGTKAVIQGTPPRGQEENALYKVRYEVTIGK